MKKKLSIFFKNHITLLFTILSGLIIIGVIYYLQNVAPLGNNSLLTIDFFHQYGPMLGELYNRIFHGSNLIYSFNMAMGLPFFRNFFNYLSSPFNIIILLFSHKDLIMSYSVVIGIKAIFSAITMGYYLKKKFNYKNLYFIPLTLLYAFCAYFTAYYWNIMWLDGLVFLPLIILGIEKIVNEEKYWLYVISLAIMLFANYFIAYMICIFAIIYFICYLIIKTNKFDLKVILKKCLIFGFSSLLAGGLCACFLIPMFNGLQSISATSDAFPNSQYYAFGVKELLLNHLSGVGSTVLKSGVSNAPNISCGVISIALLLLFFINHKINLKRKIVYAVMLLFLIFCFLYAPADFIFHGFHVPNDLPYRYSFLYSFVLIVIGAYSLYNIKYLKPYIVYIVYGLVMSLVGSLYIFKFDNINNDMILLNLIILTIWLLSYVIYIYYKTFHKFIPYILIITTMLECIIVVNNNWSVSQLISTFYNDYSNMEKAENYIKKNDNEKMYRIDRTYVLTFNDPSWYNYYGQTTFSSMAYENMAVLQHNLGLPGNEINSYYYKQTTPVYDLMFNIKYFIGTNKDVKRYDLYYNQNAITVNKSKNTVGLMYAVNKDIKKWNNNNQNPFTMQNNYVNKTTDIDNVFEKISNYEKEEIYDADGYKIIKYIIKNPGDNFYFYYDSSNIDFIIIDDTLYYNDQNYSYIDKLKQKLYIFSYEDYNEKYIINTRTDADKYTFYVGYNNYYSDNIMVYTINNNNFNKFYNILNNQKVNITEFKEDYIKGNISLENNMSIYSSIPYDEGWNVYIDGKKTKTFEIANSLLGFDISKGKHIITLEYKIPKVNLGISISFGSLLILIIWSIIKKRNKN